MATGDKTKTEKKTWRDSEQNQVLKKSIGKEKGGRAGGSCISACEVCEQFSQRGVLIKKSAVPIVHGGQRMNGGKLSTGTEEKRSVRWTLKSARRAE